MGYGITPLATDLAQVRKAIGSKNKQLLRKLRTEFRDQFETIDMVDEDDYEDDEDEDDERPARIDTRTAMGQLINGEKLSPEFGFRYLYCLEMICWHFGEFMSNDKFCPMGTEWAETVDKALRKAGVPAKVFALSKVIYRGSPVKLPPADDFPFVGHMKASEIAKALPYFAKIKLDKVAVEFREAVEQVRSWVENCAKQKWDFVSFYY